MNPLTYSLSKKIKIKERGERKGGTSSSPFINTTGNPLYFLLHTATPQNHHTLINTFTVKTSMNNRVRPHLQPPPCTTSSWFPSRIPYITASQNLQQTFFFFLNLHRTATAKHSKPNSTTTHEPPSTSQISSFGRPSH